MYYLYRKYIKVMEQNDQNPVFFGPCLYQIYNRLCMANLTRGFPLDYPVWSLYFPINEISSGSYIAIL